MQNENNMNLGKATRHGINGWPGVWNVGIEHRRNHINRGY
jgi:hypothetical protein